MDLYKNERNFYPVKKDGEIIAEIDRTFAYEIAVKLPCGYFMKFWLEFSDEKAIEICKRMKRDGIASS